jgi:peptidoglycan/LPS O-acetylase OafA/YrhL
MTEPINTEAGPGERSALPLLTALRFFAAAEVVIFHFFFPDPVDPLRALFSSGFQAVTFFFVLSGFILAYVYSGDGLADASPKSARSFWTARAARILPAYYLALAIALPAFAYSALVSKITPMDVLVPSLILTPLLLQSFWPIVAGAWNGPAWSLSVELVFYAIFPLLLRLTRRVSPVLLLLAAYGLLLAVQAGREVFHPPALGSDTAWTFYKFFPLFHVATFAFGVALGRLFLFGPRLAPRLHTMLFLLGAVGTIAVLAFRPWLPGWMGRDPVLALLYGLVIFGAARPGPLLRPLTGRWMVLLGDASYAMYILHMPIMFWWMWGLREKAHLAIPGWLDFGLYFIVLTALSIATLLVIERRVRPMIMRLLRPRKAPAQVGAVA